MATTDLLPVRIPDLLGQRVRTGGMCRAGATLPRTGLLLRCTRCKGHTGRHSASDGVHVLAVWWGDLPRDEERAEEWLANR